MHQGACGGTRLMAYQAADNHVYAAVRGFLRRRVDFHAGRCYAGSTGSNASGRPRARGTAPGGGGSKVETHTNRVNSEVSHSSEATRMGVRLQPKNPESLELSHVDQTHPQRLAGLPAGCVPEGTNPRL
jgi:hypothetical protein